MPKNRLYSTPKSSPNFNSSVEQSNRGKMRTAKVFADTVQQKGQGKENAGKTVESGSDFTSDSDSSDTSSFNQRQSKSDVKLPYSRAEDEKILEFVLKGENIFKTSSISLWKTLESKKENPKRTYQSLKNRFLRNIRPKLFTTYGGLIKNKETVDLILSKFPELRKTLREKKVLTDTLPKRYGSPKVSRGVENRRPAVAARKESGNHREKTSTQQECSGVSIPDVTEETSAAKSQPESQPLILSSDVFPATTHPWKVVCKNGSIEVTVEVSQKKQSRSKNSWRAQEGIYQKYLKHKRSNFIIPCSRCGRAGFDGYQSEDSDTDVEGRLVIASPLRTPTRQNSPKSDHSDEDDPAKKRSRKVGCPAWTSSPSLLGGTSQAGKDPTGMEKVRDHFQEPKPPEETREALQKLVTDQDLETLYWNTISFCRTLTDCESADEEEKKEAGVVKNDPKPRCLSSSSRCKGKGNVEFFFANLETGNSAIETAGKDRESLLLKNMLSERKTCGEQR